jgi:hypothetical protein
MLIETVIFLGLITCLLSILFGMVIIHLGESIDFSGHSFVLWPWYSAFGIFFIVTMVGWFTGFSLWQWTTLFFVFLMAFPGILISAQMAHRVNQDDDLHSTPE